MSVPACYFARTWEKKIEWERWRETAWLSEARISMHTLSSMRRSVVFYFLIFLISFCRCIFWTLQIITGFASKIFFFSQKTVLRTIYSRELKKEVVSLPVEICGLSTLTGRYSWPELDSCFSRNSAARSKASTPHDGDVMTAFLSFSLTHKNTFFFLCNFHYKRVVKLFLSCWSGFETFGSFTFSPTH